MSTVIYVNLGLHYNFHASPSKNDLENGKGGKKQLIVANKLMKVNEKNHQKPKSDAAMS